ncbi:MAG: DUF1700 domain-containing protein [Oscillospiraceae bacterium]|nr:DUF1700 domain-containing protein [Oscillospiraceae bacterium]
MTQKEYIRKLRSSLAFFVSENELNDIVSDLEEVFSDSMADGKSEEQICSSLGSPKDAAGNILSERGVTVSTGKMLAKAGAFAIITAVSMYFLWDNIYDSLFIMPFVPLGLLFFTENGKLTGLMEKRISLSGIISCILPMINIFLFPKLADMLLANDLSALFPLGAAITTVTAVSLVFAVLSVKTNPYGVIIPAAGSAASLCIVVLQAYAAFHLNDNVFIDIGEDIRTQQIAFRARFMNIFITTLFIAGIIIFVFSAFRRDKASISCMYAVLGTLMLLSRERSILRHLDILAETKPILHYVSPSLWAEACAMIILSVMITVCLALRKARNNG